jgi:hypothetical protein
MPYQLAGFLIPSNAAASQSVIAVAIGANESLVIVDIQAALDSARGELFGGDIMCRVTLSAERPNPIGRKHFVGRGPMVLIVTVRV